MTQTRSNGQQPVTAEHVNLMQRLAVAVQEVTTRLGIAGRLGKQYGGKRDIYSVAGYNKDPKFKDFWARYIRGDVAARLVDLMPNTMWRFPPEIVDGDLPGDESDFVQAANALAARTGLWRRLPRVDRLSRIGEFAVLFLGFAGTEDGQLPQEVTQVPKGRDAGTAPDGLLYISGYSQQNVVITDYFQDPGDARFGTPSEYEITFMREPKEIKSKVHASRVLHIADTGLEDDVLAQPILLRAWNRLDDLDKICAATGEAYWQLAARILVTEFDKDVEFQPNEREDYLDKVEAAIHDLRRVVQIRGGNLSWLESKPPDPTEAADLAITLIAASYGYPKRQLLGSETGERSTQQDVRNFYGQARERQSSFGTPLVRAFFDRCLALKILPPPTTGDYALVWPDLVEESNLEKAAANLKRAEIAKALTAVGDDPMDIVEIDQNRDVWPLTTQPLDERSTPRGGEEEESADSGTERTTP